jgi:hypothetical protein
MKGLTWNKAAIAGIGPALTTILLALDTHFGWGLGQEFWGAVLTVAFGIVAFAIPNAPSAPNVGATEAA